MLFWFSLILLISCSKQESAKNRFSNEADEAIKAIKKVEYKDYAATKKLALELTRNQSDENSQLIGEYYLKKADFLAYDAKGVPPLLEIYERLKAKQLDEYLMEIDFQLLCYYFYKEDLEDVSYILTRSLEYAMKENFDLERNAILLGPISIQTHPSPKLAESRILELLKSHAESNCNIYLVNLYLGLERIYLDANDLPKAEGVLKALIARCKASDYPLIAANAYYRLSNVYFKMDQVEKAVAALKESIDYTKAYGSYNYELQEGMLGHLEFEKGQYDSALLHYQQAVDLGLLQTDSSSLSFNYIYLGYAHFRKDKINNLAIADQYWEESNKYSDKKGMPYKMVLERRKWASGTLGNTVGYEKANLELANFLKNRIDPQHSQFMLKSLARFTIDDSSIKRLETENELKAIKLKRQQHLFAVSVILFLLVVVLIFLLKKIRTKRDQLKVSEKKLSESLTRLSAQNQVIQQQNDKLENLVAQIETSNHNLQNFAQLAAHDIKAPLRTIHGFSQLLAKRHREKIPEADREMLDFMVTGCHDLTNIIDGLLAFSKISSIDNLQLERVQLNEVIDHSLQLIRPEIEAKNARITVQEAMPPVTGSRVLLQDLFINLVSNAIKFSRTDVTPIVNISHETVNGDQLKITVQDHGIGIQEAFQQKIFDLFSKFHGPTEFEGSGIGLAMCKKIVENHGGQIWVQSQEQVGTSMIFTLPVTKNGPQP